MENLPLEQRIVLFEKPLEYGDMNFSIKPAEDNLLEIDKIKYAEGIYLPDWKEELLVLKETDPNVDIKNIQFVITSSYHVQAVKHNKAPKDITILGITGLMLTDDNKFVYGVRGGNVGSGRADVVPGGHLSAKTICIDPVFDSFYDELHDELGVLPDGEINYARVIGYYWDPVGTKATSFVLTGKLDVHSEELKEMHKTAYAVYQNAKNQGKEEQEARRDISKAGLQNIDAWEHSDLVFVDNNPDSINKIIKTKELEFQNNTYSVWDAGIAPLMLYRDKFL